MREGSFLERFPSFRTLTSTPSRTLSSSSSFSRSLSGDATPADSALKRHGSSTLTGMLASASVLGCMCENQWICDKCGTWNETGGGHDRADADRARDLKNTEAEAKAGARAAKDKTRLPHITLVCTQLQLGKGLPTLMVEYVPVTWTWQQVRFELRKRARRAVNLVFEGALVHDEASWATCVKALEEDWHGVKELLGELAVDLVPVLCGNCQLAPQPTFASVGTPWRSGSGDQEWCPLAKWQLRQMVRRMDTSTRDLQIEYKEFSAMFEQLWAVAPHLVDEAAAHARILFKAGKETCLAAGFVKIKVRARGTPEPKWAWLTAHALSFAGGIADHGKPAPRGVLALHAGVAVEKTEAQGFVVRSKDAGGAAAETVWEVECASQALQETWILALQKALSKPTAPVHPALDRDKARVPAASVAQPATPKPVVTPPPPAPAPAPKTPPLAKIETVKLPKAEKKPVKAKKKAAPAAVGGATDVGELPVRCLRVAGPQRGVCGDVHIMHRCFFDSFAGDPLSLSAAQGLLSVVENPDSSCTALLQLGDGSSGSLLCHRIARYCVFLAQKAENEGATLSGAGVGSRGEEGGSGTQACALRTGPEFLLTLHKQPLHCKIRVVTSGGQDASAGGPGGADAAASANGHAASESAGVASPDGVPGALEMRIVGVSKALVLELLQDGAKFLNHADTMAGFAQSSKGRGAAAREREEAHKLLSHASACLSMSRGEPRGSSDSQAHGGGAGIPLLDWDVEGKCLVLPVRSEQLEREMSLVELILNWAESASGQSKKLLRCFRALAPLLASVCQMCKSNSRVCLALGQGC